MDQSGMKRRGFLKAMPGAALLLSAAGAPGSVGRAALAPAFDATAESLYWDVVHYDGFGWHRSGSRADRRTGAWVAERLSGEGFTLARQDFEVPYFEARRTFVETAPGEPIEALPQWPIRTTGEAGITLPLVAWRGPAGRRSLKGRIALVHLPYGRPSTLLTPEFLTPVRGAAAAGAAAIIGVTHGPTGRAIALNAPPTLKGVAIPLVIVGSGDAGPLRDTAAAGGKVKLVLTGTGPGRREAGNIIARRGDRGPWVVVTTPLSGWFHCAAERGCGVAIFLALARWAARARADANFIFAATSGHEFEDIGARAFLESEAPRPGDVRLWLHLGAGLAARDWHEIRQKLYPLPSADAQRFLISSESLRGRLGNIFSGLAGLEVPYRAEFETAAGMLKHILGAGHQPVIGGLGAHRFHHSPDDRPDKTSGKLLLHVASAFAAALDMAVG